MTPSSLHAIGPSYLQDSDLIIVKGGITYVCKLLSPKANHAEDLRTQPCWQIKRIREYADSTGKYTEIMYPNGSQNFDFRLDEIDRYKYTFKR